MRLRQRPDYGKTHTGAAAFATCGEEGLEQATLVREGDSLAIIGDAQDRPPSARGDVNQDAPRPVADRIVGEIANNRRQLLRRDSEAEARRAGKLHRVRQFTRDLRQRRVSGRRVRLRPRHFQKAADEHGHAFSVLHRRIQKGAAV